MSLKVTGKKLETIIHHYHDVFLEKLPKDVPANREVRHQIEVESGSKLPYRPPYRLGPVEQDELEEQIKDLLAQGFIRPSCSPYRAPILFCAQERRQMANVCRLQGIEQTNYQGSLSIVTDRSFP